MKKLQNNFTTVEQSKRLLELGVPADSADMCYPVLPCNDGSTIQTTEMVIAFVDSEIKTKDTCIPCWSVGRLIEIAKICSESRYALRGLFLFLEDCEADECMSQVMDYFETCNYQFDFSRLEE